MSDRAPKSRKPKEKSNATHRGECRAQLHREKHITLSMIRGIRREDRAQAWWDIIREKAKREDIDTEIVEAMGTKMQDLR